MYDEFHSFNCPGHPHSKFLVCVWEGHIYSKEGGELSGESCLTFWWNHTLVTWKALSSCGPGGTEEPNEES